MEHLNPKKNYHPEDEYEALESVKMPVEPTTEPIADPTEESKAADTQFDQSDASEKTVMNPEMKQDPAQQRADTQQTESQATTTPAPRPADSIAQQPVQPQPIQPQQIQGYPPQYAQPQGVYPYPAYPYTGMPIYQQPYPQVQPQQMPPQPMTQQVQPQQVYQPVMPSYTQPYPPQSVPTQAPAPAPVPEQPKQPTSTGAKVFIIILCALLVALIAGFSIYIAKTASTNKKSKDKDASESQSDDGIVYPFGDNYGDYGDYGDSIGNYDTIEEEITLKADNGDTQKRDDDNADSVGKPDEKASGISLKALPSDKNSDKYTTQSAYQLVSDSVVTVNCYNGKITEDAKDIVAQGTGTIISSDGYLITNAHVIGNSKMFTINIVMNSGKTYQAKVVGYDTWSDLAVLKIDAKDLKAVTFGDSKDIVIGQDVIAIGSPGGSKFQNSLTRGIVSAVDRELSINKYVRYIQSDAAISPGNSGGPLCNIYGQVIGITTAKTIADYYENMTFSIPSATVEEIVNDLIHYGYVKGRARIGFSGSETTIGIQIEKIDENGSLAGTDIKEGDILIEFDGEPVTTFQDVYDVLANHKSGDKVSMKVQRATD